MIATAELGGGILPPPSASRNRGTAPTKTAWRLLRSPRLRYAAFHDVIDCVIYALILDRRRVHFVQIGSNDGRTGDPLWPFRDYPGWTGVLVEPVEHVFRRLQANYGDSPERFRLVKAAIAESAGMRAMHFVPERAVVNGADQLASLDRDTARHLASRAGANELISSSVRCLTFEDLCRETGTRAFDLLHIDAEGTDAEILRQVDLDRYRPTVVIFEHIHLPSSQHDSLIRMLHDTGYAVWPLRWDTLAVRVEAIVRSRALAVACRLAGPPVPPVSS